MPQNVPQPDFNDAVSHYQAGRRTAARSCAEAILNVDPENGDALNLLSVLAQDDRRWGDAEHLSLRALTSSPGNPVYLNSLGNALVAQGRTDDAIQIFERAAQAAPDEADITFNLGNAYREAGRFVDAAKAYEKTIKLRRNHLGAYNNLALTLRASGQTDSALTVLIEAIGIAPKSAELRFNLGNAMQSLGRWDGAEASYRKTLELHPRHADAMVNLGQVLIQIGRKSDAERMFRQAITIQPDLAQAYVGLADLVDDGAGDAVVHRRSVLLQKPDLAAVRSSLLMCLQYEPACSRADIADEHRAYGKIHSQKMTPLYASSKRDYRPERPLNLGIVSGDFRFHAMAFFVLPVIERRPRSDFAVTCYSTTVRTDSLTADFRKAADRWRDVRQLKVETLAELIVRDDIDVLIDLSGHAPHNRLPAFAIKPAPLQVAWGDYVDTRGLAEIDVLLGDRIHTPPSDEKYYVERVMRLAGDYICYRPPSYLPPVASTPALRNGYTTFGCFSELTKINATAVAQWAAVLRAVTDSRMCINNRLLADTAKQGQILRLFADQNIAHDRIRFMLGGDHADFLSQYSEVDVVLDTTPYSGGLTTCEALVMGVPVLTVPGDRFCGRHATSHLIHGGYPDGVCQSVGEFAAKAKTLSSDPQTLNRLRYSLRSSTLTSSLCDTQSFATGFYATLRQAWRETCEQRSNQQSKN